MSQTVVLITFFSRCGATEKQALAAAVGAVQGRALIRLRRLPDLSEAGAEAEESAECQANLNRMRKEYVPPTRKDLEGADALIIGLPKRFTPASPEWTDYLQLLKDAKGRGMLDGKVAAGLASGPAFLRTAISDLGFIAEEDDDAMTLGRKVADRVNARH